MTRETQEKWAGRIREWRESGLSPDAFAAGKDFAGSSLRAAIIELEGSVRSRTKTAAPRFVPLVASSPTSTTGSADIVVEVGGARIRVPRGSDLALVGALIRELQQGGPR
jgi:hypothetical protein